MIHSSTHLQTNLLFLLLPWYEEWGPCRENLILFLLFLRSLLLLFPACDLKNDQKKTLRRISLYKNELSPMKLHPLKFPYISCPGSHHVTSETTYYNLKKLHNEFMQQKPSQHNWLWARLPEISFQESGHVTLESDQIKASRWTSLNRFFHQYWKNMNS